MYLSSGTKLHAIDPSFKKAKCKNPPSCTIRHAIPTWHIQAVFVNQCIDLSVTIVGSREWKLWKFCDCFVFQCASDHSIRNGDCTYEENFFYGALIIFFLIIN